MRTYFYVLTGEISYNVSEISAGVNRTYHFFLIASNNAVGDTYSVIVFSKIGGLMNYSGTRFFINVIVGQNSKRVFSLKPKDCYLKRMSSIEKYLSFEILTWAK